MQKDAAWKHIYFFGDRSVPEKKAREEWERSETRLDASLYRSRRIVRDLILCNYFDYFCTFTFNDSVVNRYDYKAVKQKLVKFFNNYRSRYSPSFRYLVVPERHQDGAWHFHGVVRGIRASDFIVPETILKREGEKLIEVPNTPKYVSWSKYSLGHFNCSLIRSHAACARYVAKYITKDLDSMDLGKQIVLHSQGLEMPELVFDEDNFPCQFTAETSTEFCKLAFLGDDFTVGDFVPEWYGYSDSVTLDSDPLDCGDFEVIPLSIEQLKFS